ncbi:MAG: tetratricopeptide repeat protein, partial [Synechococcales cyanobacterium M58_A2018_015]|nr:tetratricopeptide repeat protein [Synechococcales cyanobacterium M58_A2018_015]
YSRLGVIYFKTNQATMAKIHFNKALELNPQDEVALEGKRRLESPNGKGAPTSRPDAGGGKSASRGRSDSKGGGLFGLFGNKKK